MGLPNPGMDFTPFDVLPASELDDMVENIEALATGSGLDNDAITTAKVAADAITPVKMNNTMRWGVYRNAALNSGSSGLAIITFDTEIFDPANIYNTSNGRLTATVAGDYQVNAASVMNTTDSFRIFIYKNGVNIASGSTANGTGVVTSGSQCGKLIRLAVGDYLEVFSFYNTAAQPLAVGDANTYFTGFLMHDNT